MSRSSKIYAYFIAVSGLLLGSYCTYLYIESVLASTNPGKELAQFVVLLLLYVICRCFPIDIRDDYAIDMSFICNLATILCKGPVAAATIVLFGTPFIITKSNHEDKRFYHIFNTEPIKTAFNSSNLIIAVFIAGVTYLKTGGVIGSLGLPRALFPGVLSTIVYFMLNCAILIVLFALDRKVPFFPTFLKNMIEFFPNSIAAAPIGYFIAQFLLRDGGEYFILLFMIPLMLARYSFVLYLDVKQNYYNMVKTLTAALEAKDVYTEGHSHRVEGYAVQIAQKMHVPNYQIENIRTAALLHDIGKIGIDDKILNKPDRLTPEERAIIMTHPQISANILKNVKLNKAVRTAIIHHHERYDGSGYPDHTKGDDLPIEVYIIALADAYDAMTSNRPYCSSLSIEQVESILKEESGKQFHPRVVAAFLEVLHDSGEI